jgi:hypothetical protein
VSIADSKRPETQGSLHSDLEYGFGGEKVEPFVAIHQSGLGDEDKNCTKNSDDASARN